MVDSSWLTLHAAHWPDREIMVNMDHVISVRDTCADNTERGCWIDLTGSLSIEVKETYVEVIELLKLK